MEGMEELAWSESEVQLLAWAGVLVGVREWEG